MNEKQDESFLDKLSHLKNRLQFSQRYLSDLQEEKNNKEKLSNGRRKWLNKEISKTKDKIEELDQKLVDFQGETK